MFMQHAPSNEGGLPVVNSFNEWDPLEEVIVGVIDGATVPPWHAALQATMPEQHWEFFRQQGGKQWPRELLDAARTELDEFTHILELEGVVVRRPEVTDFARPYSTPEWQSASGLYSAMPRDLLLVVGDEIIEAPLCWRSRYFEVHSYRPLLKEYFRRGARWTAAPRPQLSDELYDDLEPAQAGETKLLLTEFEPAFDAAEFVRCGRDIFYQKSHVTNDFGVAWLSRHLGPQYRFHKLRFNDSQPMHIDATFLPLSPGKVLINPTRVNALPKLFERWEKLVAPPPCIPGDHTLYMSSGWLSMNVLMLDEERVVVEKHEETLIRALRDWGFKPIPCRFRNFNRFGGSFHCATVDVRRRGGLQSYFD